jgi:nitrite reductase (NADH) small subunit
MTLLEPTATAIDLTTPPAEIEWQDICALERLTVERGSAALVAGRPVALFRLDGDEVLAVDDVDPFWDVPVLSRGLVGCVGGRDTVASPLLKQRFDLRTGQCLDDPSVAVGSWPVRVHQGRVEVAHAPSAHAP